MKQDFNSDLIRSFLAALDCGGLLGAAKMPGTRQPTGSLPLVAASEYRHTRPICLRTR